MLRPDEKNNSKNANELTLAELFELSTAEIEEMVRLDERKNSKKTALELLFDLSSAEVERCRPVMKPHNVDHDWCPWTHKYFPVLFRCEVFVLLCVRKRLRWMSRDVLTLLIRALAELHRDMPQSISWTLPTDMFSTLTAPAPPGPPLAWPYPIPVHQGHPYLSPHPSPYPSHPYPLAGFQANYMG
jgi:hypothetical protein